MPSMTNSPLIWRRRAAVGLATSAALTLAGGCSRGYSPPEGVAIATYQPRGTGGDSALLAGTLEVVGGCLVVREADGARTLPIWPSDRLPAQIGEAVSVGGGGRETATGASIPQVCADLALPMFQVNR